ncbi:MAG TPA: FecR domain-containing protein [Bacteroidales bacterium]|nr:FecR domain-containing protein [Bacteroidales bacterium]
MHENVPYDLIASALEGACNAQEQNELDLWIAQSPANRAIYEEMKSLWAESQQIADNFSPDAHQALARVHQRIGAGHKAKVFSLNSISWAYKIAASILIVAGALFFFVSNKKPVQLAAITDNKSNSEIVLSDNSVVKLNKNSKLTYPEYFKGKERRLRLEGEALFDVTKDKEKPFVVEVGQTKVTVLGTYFNVRAYSLEDSIVVSLLEGKVEFAIEGKDAKVILTAGEKGLYIKSKGSLTKMEEQNTNVTSWNTGILKFEALPLANVCTTLSEHYGISICIKNASDANLRFTGTFKNQRLSEILLSIEEATNLKAVKNGNSIIFE